MGKAYSGFGYLFKKSLTVVDKSSDMLASVGSAMQTQLDQTGLTTGVAYYVGKTAEGTKNLGTSIYQTGSTVVQTANQNEYVNGFTQTSQKVIGSVANTMTGASYVLL